MDEAAEQYNPNDGFRPFARGRLNARDGDAEFRARRHACFGCGGGPSGPAERIAFRWQSGGKALPGSSIVLCCSFLDR